MINSRLATNSHFAPQRGSAERIICASLNTKSSTLEHYIDQTKEKESLGYPISNPPPANGEIVMFPSSRESVAEQHLLQTELGLNEISYK